MSKSSTAGARTEMRVTIQKSSESGFEFPQPQRADQIEPREIDWLWKPFVPLGHLTIIEGLPDQGKSTLATYIAAQVTTGRPFEHSHCVTRGTVVYIGGEDPADSVIRPRFDKLGGERRRFVIFNDPFPLDHRDGIAFLEAILIDYRPMLVVIDPLSVFVKDTREDDVGSTLNKLRKLARQHHTAIVVIRHTRKSGGQTELRGSGNIGIFGAARSVLLVAYERHDRNRRVVFHTKMNWAQKSPPLIFSFENGLTWGGTASYGVEALSDIDENRASKQQLAGTFLREVLAKGAVLQRELDRAAHEAGHSTATIRRASKQLRVQKRKQSDGRWYWSLPSAKA